MENVELPAEVGPYRLIKKLGYGRRSVIALYDLQSSIKPYFFKIIPKSAFSNQSDIISFLSFIREIKKISFNGIVAYEDVFDDYENVYLCSKYCNKGNIGNFIINRGALSESISRKIFKQLLSSLSFLQDLGIAHRDIKTENILIDEQMDVAITDFEYATYVSNVKNDIRGTFLYAAPEVTNKNYDLFAADVWSLGVILYILLVGAFPWNKNKDMSIQEQIQGGIFDAPKTISIEAIDLLHKILDPNPETRLTIKGIRMHPWLYGNKLPINSVSAPLLIKSSPIKPANDYTSTSSSTVRKMIIGEERKRKSAIHYKRAFPTFM